MVLWKYQNPPVSIVLLYALGRLLSNRTRNFFGQGLKEPTIYSCVGNITNKTTVILMPGGQEALMPIYITFVTASQVSD